MYLILGTSAGDKQDIEPPVKSLVFAIFILPISCKSCFYGIDRFPIRGQYHLSNEMVFLSHQECLWRRCSPIKHISVRATSAGHTGVACDLTYNYEVNVQQGGPEDVPEKGESHRELFSHINETKARVTGEPETGNRKTGRCREPDTRRSTGRPEGWARPARNLSKVCHEWVRRCGSTPGLYHLGEAAAQECSRETGRTGPEGPDLGPSKRLEAKEVGVGRRWTYCGHAAVSGASLYSSGPHPEDRRSSAGPMGRSGGAPAAGAEHGGGVRAYREEVTISGTSLYGSRPHLRVQSGSSGECRKVKKELPW
ncbi:hypothetical protein B0H19DRAFT_1083715 [Mycena capillaripes]|nr:hypothetical protein B0H19DRAFT_1083715 [Mycena capillaripes]